MNSLKNDIFPVFVGGCLFLSELILSVSLSAVRLEDGAARWWPCMQYLAHSRARRDGARSQSQRPADTDQSATKEATVSLIQTLWKVKANLWCSVRRMAYNANVFNLP